MVACFFPCHAQQPTPQSEEVKNGTITGRVFNVHGGRISVAEGWNPGPEASVDRRWDPAELGEIIPKLVADAEPNVAMARRAARS